MMAFLNPSGNIDEPKREGYAPLAGAIGMEKMPSAQNADLSTGQSRSRVHVKDAERRFHLDHIFSGATTADPSFASNAESDSGIGLPSGKLSIAHSHVKPSRNVLLLALLLAIGAEGLMLITGRKEFPSGIEKGLLLGRNLSVREMGMSAKSAASKEITRARIDFTPITLNHSVNFQNLDSTCRTVSPYVVLAMLKSTAKDDPNSIFVKLVKNHPELYPCTKLE